VEWLHPGPSGYAQMRELASRTIKREIQTATV
jgi:hypothetical protein